MLPLSQIEITDRAVLQECYAERKALSLENFVTESKKSLLPFRQVNLDIRTPCIQKSKDTALLFPSVEHILESLEGVCSRHRDCLSFETRNVSGNRWKVPS